jgi:hypothetical protein
MNAKAFLTTFAIALVAIAVVSRVPMVGKLVTGA